jgi:hypothetical protein
MGTRVGSPRYRAPRGATVCQGVICPSCRRWAVLPRLRRRRVRRSGPLRPARQSARPALVPLSSGFVRRKLVLGGGAYSVETISKFRSVSIPPESGIWASESHSSWPGPKGSKCRAFECLLPRGPRTPVSLAREVAPLTTLRAPSFAGDRDPSSTQRTMRMVGVKNSRSGRLSAIDANVCPAVLDLIAIFEGRPVVPACAKLELCHCTFGGAAHARPPRSPCDVQCSTPKADSERLAHEAKSERDPFRCPGAQRLLARIRRTEDSDALE